MQKLLICLFIFVSTMAFSQKQKLVHLGAIAGINSTNLSAAKSYGVTSKSRINPEVGLFAELGLSKKMSLMSGIRYTSFSYTSNDIEAFDAETGNDLGPITKHSINYLRIPMDFFYNISQNKAIFKIGLGGSIDFPMSDNIDLKFTNFPFTVNEPAIKGTKGLSVYNSSLNLSFGVQLSKIAAFLKFQSGIYSIFDRENDMLPQWQSRSFGLQVAYYIR